MEDEESLAKYRKVLMKAGGELKSLNQKLKDPFRVTTDNICSLKTIMNELMENMTTYIHEKSGRDLIDNVEKGYQNLLSEIHKLMMKLGEKYSKIIGYSSHRPSFY